MTIPVVTWHTENEEGVLEELTEDYIWSLGQVKAGLKSDEKSFVVWNNKGGETDVSPMQDCKITIVDNQSEHKDVIEEKWIHCRVDTLEGDAFSPIGGSEIEDGKEIRAKNEEPGIIRGLTNDGTEKTESNFSRITLYAKPNTETINSGVRKFKVRVSYFYV